MNTDSGRGQILDVIAAAERTALAWERTGFGLVAVGAVVVHGSKNLTGPAQITLGIAVVAAGAVTSVVIAPVRYRRIVSDVRGHRSTMAGRTLRAVTLVLCAVAFAATLLLRV